MDIKQKQKNRTIEQNGILKKYRNRIDEILFMDLRELGIPFEKKFVQFSEDDINKISNTYHIWQQVDYEKSIKISQSFVIVRRLKRLLKRLFVSTK